MFTHCKYNLIIFLVLSKNDCLGIHEMRCKDAEFMPSQAGFTPHFLYIVVEVRAIGFPHVSKTVVYSKEGNIPSKNVLLKKEIHF